jgi:plasmid stabilization system protein ParE
MYRIEILPLAKQDIQQAVSWYNLKQNNLGNRFLRALQNEVKVIQKNPAAFINRYNHIHTFVMNDFPFMIHYLIENELKKVIIVAVFHTSLNPDNWQRK